MEDHTVYMERCLFLARRAIGHTYPNPLVGSVIVHKGEIIGEGWHTQAGEAHAEVNAIASVKDKNLLKESTLYVNLEPCAHFGKTPPCADLIIEKEIPKIVIGCKDIYSKVAGKGIERLQNAGRKVILGVLEEECKRINQRFFTFHSQKRPYIILKWAQTSDNFIAPLEKSAQRPVWITNALSQQLAHLWRAQEQSILVGKHTVLEDNPSLTTRHWHGKSPLRLVIDPHLSIPPSFDIYKGGKTVVFTTYPLSDSASVHYESFDTTRSMPQQVADYLYQEEVQSLIVEGGTTVLQQFVDDGLWDEARIFVGQCQFLQGVKAPLLQGNLLKVQDIQGDKLFVYKNTKLS